MTITRRSALAAFNMLLPRLVWLLLAACGGQSGNSGITPSLPTPPTPAQVTAEGIWTGTVLSRCDFATVRALVTHEGNLFAGTPAGTYVGSVTEGPPFDVIAVKYAPEQDTPLALVAQPDAEALAIASVQTRTRLQIEWARQDNFCSSGGTSLHYNALFERPASLAIIEGVYTDGSMSMAVNSEGVISGSDLNGCVLNGTVAVVHSNRNYYSAAIDVDSCPASGTYEGAAYIGDATDGGQNNELFLFVANTQHAIRLRLDK